MAEEFGGREALEQTLDESVKKWEAENRRKSRKKAKPASPKPARSGLSVEAARRMAADLEGFDSKIVGGRLRG